MITQTNPAAQPFECRLTACSPSARSRLAAGFSSHLALGTRPVSRRPRAGATLISPLSPSVPLATPNRVREGFLASCFTPRVPNGARRGFAPDYAADPSKRPYGVVTALEGAPARDTTPQDRASPARKFGFGGHRWRAWVWHRIRPAMQSVRSRPRALSEPKRPASL